MAAKKRTNSRQRPQPGWLTRKEAIASCNVSGTAFDKWKAQPVAKIGRYSYYTFECIDKARSAIREARHQEQMGQLIRVVDVGEELNPIIEKAKLDRSKRIGQELANDQAQGNVFPIVAAEYVFAQMGAEIAAILDSLPAKIKRVMPKMTATSLTTIKREIAKARNSAADVSDKFDEFLEEHYS